MPALVAEPTSFPLRLDITRSVIDFVRLSRDEITEAAFLDYRAPHAGVTVARALMTEVKAQWDEAKRADDVRPAARAYIFHTAFCSSTLISRCLDAPGRTLVLKEPQLLVDLSSAKRFGAPQMQSQIRGALRLSINLLARPFEGEDHVVIKPSNGANDLLPDLLEEDRQAQALLLFTDIRAFLISVIKRGETGRSFVRMLLHHPWGRDARFQGLTRDDVLQMTDLKAAALAWRFQAEAFAKVLAGFPAERVRALDADAFRRDPACVLSAIDRFFGLGLGSDHITETVEGPLFTTDSKKQGEVFDPQSNLAMTQEIENRYGKDLDAIVKWSEQLPFEKAARLHPRCWTIRASCSRREYIPTQQ